MMNPSTEVPFFMAAQQLVKECGTLVNDIERNLVAIFGSLPSADEIPNRKPPVALAHEHLQALEDLKTRLVQVALRLDGLTGGGTKRDTVKVPTERR